MTHSERIAALEAQLADVKTKTDLFRRVVSEDGRVPGLMLDGRLGICTEYWMKKPFGQGATFSVGTAIDRYAGYFEIDEEACPDHPSVAVFASVTCLNPSGQPHHAFEGVVNNSANARGLVLTFADKTMCLRVEGLEAMGIPSFLIGTPANHKQLWP